MVGSQSPGSNLIGPDGSLTHYGVKGMKWGVVHDPGGGGGGGSSKPPPTASDVKNFEAHMKKIGVGGTRTLNNKELQEVVNRMNLEQNYSRMMHQKGSLESGHDAVKNILGYGATANNIYNFLQTPMMKGLRKLLIGI